MYPCRVTLPLYCEGREPLEQVAQRCSVPVQDQVGWALSSLVKWEASPPVAGELE